MVGESMCEEATIRPEYLLGPQLQDVCCVQFSQPAHEGPLENAIAQMLCIDSVMKIKGCIHLVVVIYGCY